MSPLLTGLPISDPVYLDRPLRHGPGLCGCPGATIVPGLHSPVATDVPRLIPCSSHILPTPLDVWVAKRGALLRATLEHHWTLVACTLLLSR
ncbi:hypothetical protein EYF80_005097 [Liparis tanakae]|uniref:Uncharacterized protein n=1 Tax=Liparis tanakae TaxID=230148 RepID=A0A4Z2J5C1_9TELE|nr:hypothetical protein EYF80_005097 [Liparis tanakae]